MRFTAKEVTLKNGLRAVLKSPEPKDSEKMLEYLRQTSGETGFMLRYPEEVTLTDEQEKTFLEAMLESPNSIMIAAFDGEELMGNASINLPGDKIKVRHRSVFGIAIKQKYWGLGIGDILTEECLKWAENQGFEQVELEVATRNYKAISLYQKHGFEFYGTRPNAFKYKDGTYESEHLMVRRF